MVNTNKSKSNYNNSNNAKIKNSVFGSILFIIGLLLILMRADITVAIIGKEKLITEVFGGGNSGQITLLIIVIIGVISMISGLPLLILSFANTTSGTSTISTPGYIKTQETNSKSKILLVKVENPDLYIKAKAFDPQNKIYLGKIVNIDTIKGKCVIRSDFGKERELDINEIMVNQLFSH